MESTANIAAHLPARARLAPTQWAVIEPRGPDHAVRIRQWTYQELDAESDALAAGLMAIGIGAGTRTVLMVPPSLEFFALTFALFKAGIVPVMIDPGMGVRHLKQCIAEAEPAAFIGVPKAHLARILLSWGRASIRTAVSVGPRLSWGQWSYAAVRRLGQKCDSQPLAPPTEDQPAAILFTSGSTGVPKGVVYTHAIFNWQVRLLQEVYRIEPGEIDLPTFPLFALFAPALGMTAILPEMDATRPGSVEPTRILREIERFGVTNMFGSPALLDRVGRYGSEHGTKLSTLRRVISAGAPVQAPILQRFTTMLPAGTQVHTPYGATESLPVSTIGSEEILGSTSEQTKTGAGVCVGRPIAPMTVRIIRITDEPIEPWSDDLVLPTGAIGEIAVQGPVVTRSYFRREDSTRLAKIIDGATHWHRMGDCGYFDAQGRLWFCGRKSHRVVLPDRTLFTIPCEGIFNAHPLVRRSALVGARIDTRVSPTLCVESVRPLSAAEELTVRLELLMIGRQHAVTQGIETILFHPKFPVDIRHNAKIFREKLADWASVQLQR